MLQSLRISHFAIIDALTVEFDRGFTVLTGETGAGKSILVDAINLLLGGRASQDLIRSGEDSATVEALFVRVGTEVREAAEAVGVEVAADELLVKRVVSRSGKNRIFLNGGPATLSMLEALGPKLIDIAGQHEHQTLLYPESHRRVVDSAGDLGVLVEEMRTAHKAWRVAVAEVEGLSRKEADRIQREDYLRFQVEELRRVDPREGEEAVLLAERRRLVHAETLCEAVTRSEEALYSGDGAVVERLRSVRTWLESAAKLDPRLEGTVQAVRVACVDLEEAARTLRDSQGDEGDAAKLDGVEGRLAELERLRKKHAVAAEPDGMAELLELKAKLEEELEALSSYEEALATRRRAEEAARAAAGDVASRLGKARKKTARLVGAEVEAELHELGMPHTRFEISIRPGELSESGGDVVEFLIAPNPGEAAKPLARTASGGELSRVMLALKCVVAGHHPVASFVFDEVDAGIGGAIAERIGQKLAAISGRKDSVGTRKGRSRGETSPRDGLAAPHQVLCITHLPQVASHADAHLHISKSIGGGRTSVRLDRLGESARQEEIARMLGGREITSTTRAHANEMLSRSTARARRTASSSRKSAT